MRQHEEWIQSTSGKERKMLMTAEHAMKRRLSLQSGREKGKQLGSNCPAPLLLSACEEISRRFKRRPTKGLTGAVIAPIAGS